MDTIQYREHTTFDSLYIYVCVGVGWGYMQPRHMATLTKTVWRKSMTAQCICLPAIISKLANLLQQHALLIAPTDGLEY